MWWLISRGDLRGPPRGAAVGHRVGPPWAPVWGRRGPLLISIAGLQPGEKVHMSFPALTGRLRMNENIPRHSLSGARRADHVHAPEVNY